MHSALYLLLVSKNKEDRISWSTIFPRRPLEVLWITQNQPKCWSRFRSPFLATHVQSLTPKWFPFIKWFVHIIALGSIPWTQSKPWHPASIGSPLQTVWVFIPNSTLSSPSCVSAVKWAFSETLLCQQTSLHLRLLFLLPRPSSNHLSQRTVPQNRSLLPPTCSQFPRCSRINTYKHDMP